MKTTKKEKAKRVVQSTQQNIPVRDFVDGVVVTDDNKYVKILEVLPVPLFLKKVSEQNKIGDAFAGLLKSAPSQLHIKSISLPADLSQQIEDVKKNIEKEPNDNCKKMGREYEQTLENGQKYGVSRRFFISFPYTGKLKGNKPEEIAEIVQTLNVEAERLSSRLRMSGNETVEQDPENPNEAAARLFYLLYNRSAFLDIPFEERLKAVYEKYTQAYGNENFFIPPQDYIAPKKIQYSNAKYMVIDDRYYSFLYIPSYGYNPYVTTGWLDNFVNSYNGVDVDIYLKRMEKDEVQGSIKRNIGRSTVSLSETSDITDSYEQSSQAVRAGYYLKNGLAQGQDFYYMSIMLTVSGTSIEDVSAKKEELKKIARQMDITLRENMFECEKSFRASLPTSQFDDKFMAKMKRNVLTEGASSLYPFTTFQMIDSKGIYLADDANGSPVITDQFNRYRFNNPHIFICGETGAGKTIAVLLLAIRARIKHLPVFILAPEKQHEFQRLCEAIGGQFVSIGAGSPHRINIMDIFVPTKEALEKQKMIDGSSSYETTSYLAEKVATLMEFLELHIKDITLEEKQMLNEAILETYRRKGINKGNDSLWRDKEHTKLKRMPTLKDLVKVLAEKEETIRLTRVVKLLTQGEGEHFSGQTNINVDNPFFVIGLEHNTANLLGLSIYMAMDYCWSRIKEDRTENKFLIIDEWWKLAFNPIAAEKSLQISKIARALGCSMVIATQQMSDILAIEDGKYGNAVLNNCATKILMSMKEKDVLSVKDMVGLTNAECSKILRFKAGQGLFISGDNRLTLKFNPSYTEKLLTFTDEKTLAEYAKVKEEDEIRKRNQEFLDGLEKLEPVTFTSEDVLKRAATTELISMNDLATMLEEVI